MCGVCRDDYRSEIVVDVVLVRTVDTKCPVSLSLRSANLAKIAGKR